MKHTDTKATSSPANAYNNPNRKKKWFDTCQETSSEGQTNHRACEEVFNRPLIDYSPFILLTQQHPVWAEESIFLTLASLREAGQTISPSPVLSLPNISFSSHLYSCCCRESKY